jgi:hypothetical protein
VQRGQPCARRPLPPAAKCSRCACLFSGSFGGAARQRTRTSVCVRAPASFPRHRTLLVCIRLGILRRRHPEKLIANNLDFRPVCLNTVLSFSLSPSRFDSSLTPIPRCHMRKLGTEPRSSCHATVLAIPGCRGQNHLCPGCRGQNQKTWRRSQMDGENLEMI